MTIVTVFFNVIHPQVSRWSLSKMLKSRTIYSLDCHVIVMQLYRFYIHFQFATQYFNRHFTANPTIFFLRIFGYEKQNRFRYVGKSVIISSPPFQIGPGCVLRERERRACAPKKRASGSGEIKNNNHFAASTEIGNPPKLL